jgi:hypothetical protein
MTQIEDIEIRLGKLEREFEALSKRLDDVALRRPQGTDEAFQQMLLAFQSRIERVEEALDRMDGDEESGDQG